MKHLLLILSMISNIAYAGISSLTIEATLEERNGKMAVINHNGERAEIPVERIENGEKARVGTTVKVTLHANEFYTVKAD